MLHGRCRHYTINKVEEVNLMWLYFQTSPNSLILRQTNETFVSNSTTQMIIISFQGTWLCKKKTLNFLVYSQLHYEISGNFCFCVCAHVDFNKSRNLCTKIFFSAIKRPKPLNLHVHTRTKFAQLLVRGWLKEGCDQSNKEVKKNDP